MASGVHFNPASFQIQGSTRTARSLPAEQATVNPNDGFQPSEAAQPAANTAAVEKLTLNVTAEQLASTAFQQTLATLSASGIQVNVAVLEAGGDRWAEDRGEISTRSRRSADNDESQHGIIAHSKPAAPKRKPKTTRSGASPKPQKTRKAPTYGGD